MNYINYRQQLQKLRNLPPRNPIQTSYLRFLKTPGAELKTSYMKDNPLERINGDLSKLSETMYTKYLKEI